MTISLTHALWVWFLAAYFFCIFLTEIFKVPISGTVTGILALLIVIGVFVKLTHAGEPT